MQSEKDALIERYASDAFKNRKNPDLPLGVWRQHFVEFADKLAALSTDAEPVAYGVFTKNKHQTDYRFSNLCSDTNDDANELGREYFTDQFIIKPLYAEPVKTAPAVAVSREEMAERLFGTDWPNDKWDRFKDGDHAKERYLRMADTALSAQVQDVAGWQPIETAPKDGSKFIAWHPHGYVDFFHWQKHENTGWRDSFIQVYREGSGPAHWMPLPASPASKHGDAE